MAVSDKRYQVFVSSTYEDLKEERNKVIQALLSSNCIPISMENFNAASEDQFTIIKDLIEECDYYVLILGGRYGSIKDGTDKSYTQLEYEWALANDVPTIAFYYDNIDSLPADHVETDSFRKQKLQDFHTLVKQKLCKSWNSPDNLALNVVMSLNDLMRKHPRIGWVRGDSVSNNEANQQIVTLQRENESLKAELTSYRKLEEMTSQNFQQHDDKLVIKMISNEELVKNPFGIQLDIKPIEFELTWDEIFALVGSTFIAPKRTDRAIDSLTHVFAKYKNCEDTHYLDVECGQAILSQFYALHYIELRTGEVYQAGVESCYVLTEYGMNEFVKLTAKKKCKHSN